MPNYKSSGSKKFLKVAVIVLVLAAGTVAALELTNTTHIFHKKPAPVSGSQYTKGENSSNTGASNSSDGQTSTSNTQPENQKSTPASGNYATLVKPTGDFVSNHHPSLSNTPTAPNTESSVCTTTPGAKCTIIFTKGSQAKSLVTQTTDSGGSTYWSWKLQDIGLTAGSWRIKVVATLGGHTSTAYDAQNLEVSQ